MAFEQNAFDFSGIIGKEYDMLRQICPQAEEMSRLVGVQVQNYKVEQAAKELRVLEIGGGTGITTLHILANSEDVRILSVDNESVMQKQAQASLKNWVVNDKLQFKLDDALHALQEQAPDSMDIVASAYTLHNFLQAYRGEVLKEIFRVLKPGGIFINGDRYALDDISQHTALVQKEVSGYFDVLTRLQRLDLLEHWIVHLMSDESQNHVMRESTALQEMRDAGFTEIKLSNRQQVNALVTAIKPQF